MFFPVIKYFHKTSGILSRHCLSVYPFNDLFTVFESTSNHIYLQEIPEYLDDYASLEPAHSNSKQEYPPHFLCKKTFELEMKLQGKGGVFTVAHLFVKARRVYSIQALIF